MAAFSMRYSFATRCHNGGCCKPPNGPLELTAAAVGPFGASLRRRSSTSGRWTGMGAISLSECRLSRRARPAASRWKIPVHHRPARGCDLLRTAGAASAACSDSAATFLSDAPRTARRASHSLDAHLNAAHSLIGDAVRRAAAPAGRAPRRPRAATILLGTSSACAARLVSPGYVSERCAAHRSTRLALARCVSESSAVARSATPRTRCSRYPGAVQQAVAADEPCGRPPAGASLRARSRTSGR